MGVSTNLEVDEEWKLTHGNTSKIKEKCDRRVLWLKSCHVCLLCILCTMVINLFYSLH